MQTSRCNQECSYFRWDEVGANFKAYCMKDSMYLKEMGSCPMRWAAGVTTNETITS